MTGPPVHAGGQLIWVNGPVWFFPIIMVMAPPEEPLPVKYEPPPKPSRLEEARRAIEEYADDLREIIKKLRRKMD
jgi:hypothetical protein